jgi:hypothetical protein
MDEITHSDKNITAFGGLNIIFKAIIDKGLDGYLDARIGSRGACAKFSHSDIVLSLLGNALCQGSFVSDLQILKEKYKGQFFHQVPSPDTVEYVCQQLKTKTIKEETDKGVIHLLNYSNDMNETLVGLAVKTGQLKAGKKGYVLDFDNVVVENEKQDAVRSYKKTKGYHPNLAFIGRVPVHIENHNGNTPAKYGQKETLERCFGNLGRAGIRVGAFRADSASYQQGVIALAGEHADSFYIRIVDCEKLRRQCGAAGEWNKVTVNNVSKEAASIQYRPFGKDQAYRAVITRTPRKDKQTDILSGTAYDYYGIITNDEVKTDQQVIEFYNQRGDSENSNRYMLNDFNLHHLPFPDMCTNTVFMYLMAMCATLFEWIKQVLVANKTKAISANMRVKAVCFHYIAVAATYITHARKKALKVFAPTGSYRQLTI